MPYTHKLFPDGFGAEHSAAPWPEQGLRRGGPVFSPRPGAAPLPGGGGVTRVPWTKLNRRPVEQFAWGPPRALGELPLRLWWTSRSLLPAAGVLGSQPEALRVGNSSEFVHRSRAWARPGPVCAGLRLLRRSSGLLLRGIRVPEQDFPWRSSEKALL